MKFKYLPAMSLLLAVHASAETSSAPVVQDGWIGPEGPSNPGATVVQDGGVGSQLNLATPNPSGAAQYTRKAWFGFDLAALKAAVAGQYICSASITFQLSTNVSSSYNGNNAIRFYGVANVNPGSPDGTATNSSFFDETLTTWDNAPGNMGGNVLAGDKVNGSILGDVAVPNPAASGVMVLTGPPLVDFINASISGTNTWITVATTYLGQNNNGYGKNAEGFPTGLSFVSKEGGTGSAVLAVDYQATPCPMLVLSQPQSGYYYPGSTVDLSVEVSGEPVIEYQWQHEGTNLPGATGSVLQLSNLQASDAGGYQAFMTNPTGSTNSSVATIGVLSPPAVSGGFEEYTGTNQALGYWRLNESTPVQQDLATNSGTLGATGSGSYVGVASHPQTGALVGSSDTAASFAGGRVQVPFAFELNPATFTIEAWLKPAVAHSGTTLTCPLASMYVTSPRAGWNFYQSASGWNFRTYDQNGSTAAVNITGGPAPVADEWYHVVATWDGTVGRVYVNGVLSATSDPKTFVANYEAPFTAGARSDGAFAWSGAIDEVAYYATVLSDAQILAHYQNGTNASPPAAYDTLITADGAVEYLRLNEPSVIVTAVNRGTRGPAADGTYVPLSPPAAPGIATGASGPQPPEGLGFEAGNKAATFSGAYVSLPGVNLNKNTATIAAWIKRNGSQQNWSGLLFTRAEGTTAGLHFGDGPNDLRYTWAGGRWDWSSGLIVPDGVWTFAAVVIEPTRATMYMYDGTALQSAVNTATHAAQGFAGVTYLGLDPNNFTTRTINGDLDEVAIFDRALAPEEIAGLVSSSRYGSTAPSITRGPQSRSIFAGQPAVFDVIAAGSLPLSYQWMLNDVPIPGATGASLAIPNAYYAAAATYGVTVNNAVGPATSSSATLTVLAPPTFANLTNDLVLHLQFEDDVQDSSGRGNHGTAMGSPTFVSGQLGKALHYNTDVDQGIYNYVTLGSPADLQFGSTTNFSVAYWVRFTGLPGDLPFLCSAANSYGAFGLTFAPSWEAGGWSYHMGGDTGSAGLYGEDDTINDGNWHSLVHTFDRAGDAVTYLDGNTVDTRSITSVGSADSGLPFSIGQDPTGFYQVSGEADIDDLGIWQRVLSGTEAQSIYLVGLQGRTFNTYGPVSVTLQKSGGDIEIIWEAGSLESADTVGGPYTPVTGAAAPFHKVTPGSGAKFYRVKL